LNKKLTLFSSAKDVAEEDLKKKKEDFKNAKLKV